MINFIILAAAEKLMKLRTRTLRITLASALGSLFSLAILLDIRGILFSLAVKLISTIAISAAAFRFGSFRELAKNSFMTFSVSVIFSGLMTAIYMLFRPPNMLIINDIVYFEFDPLVMLAVTAAIYAVVYFAERLLRERLRSTVVKLSFTAGGENYSVIGKIDTGCSLTEPFSGSPVIIVDRSVYTAQIGETSRIIPYSAISGSSALFANKAESAEIDGKAVDKSLYIAAADIPSKTYQALIGPDILR